MEAEKLNPDGLYHLASLAAWSDYQQDGQIDPSSLDDEGFIHCSWGYQVTGTVAKHFPFVTDLVALEVDRTLLTDVVLVEEDLYGSGHPFPHVYGPIPVGAVVEVVSII